MKTQDISALITKYYEGELSVVEESQLKELLDETKDEDFSEVKMHMEIMDQLSSDEDLLDDSFDQKVLTEISNQKANKKVWFTGSRIISGIAATALILISLWVVTNIVGSKDVYGTVNDPEIAFSETKKALQKVSKNVKKGVNPATTTINKVDDKLEKTKEIKKAAKAIENMKNINRLNSPSLLLNTMTKVTVKYGKS